MKKGSYIIICGILLWLCMVLTMVLVNYFFHFPKGIRPLQLLTVNLVLAIETLIIIYICYEYGGDHFPSFFSFWGLVMCFFWAMFGLMMALIYPTSAVVARLGGLGMFVIANLIIACYVKYTNDEPLSGDNNQSLNLSFLIFYIIYIYI